MPACLSFALNDNQQNRLLLLGKVCTNLQNSIEWVCIMHSECVLEPRPVHQRLEMQMEL